MKLDSNDFSLIRRSLREDAGSGDVTSELLIEKGRKAAAFIVAKEMGVFCGGPVAAAVFKCAEPRLKIRLTVPEGAQISKGKIVMEITGPARGILKGERTALNFLGRLSGISTRTAEFVRLVKKYRTRVLDTRKTTPLWRKFEKYAVKTGGGKNHRMGLYDAVFVKENHRIHGDLKKLKGRRGLFEIEVRNFRELTEALMLRPKVILLDNFTPVNFRRAARLARKANPRIVLEASGGISEKNIAAFAAAGADQVSAGSLTHSIRCLDFSLLMKA